MEGRGKFEYTLGNIEHIDIMIRIDIFYATCHLEMTSNPKCFTYSSWFPRHKEIW